MKFLFFEPFVPVIKVAPPEVENDQGECCFALVSDSLVEDLGVGHPCQHPGIQLRPSTKCPKSLSTQRLESLRNLNKHRDKSTKTQQKPLKT